MIPAPRDPLSWRPCPGCGIPVPAVLAACIPCVDRAPADLRDAYERADFSADLPEWLDARRTLVDSIRRNTCGEVRA